MFVWTSWGRAERDRPLFAFARDLDGVQDDRGTKSKPIPGPHLVYSFLTTSPNAVVAPIHRKTMPVPRHRRGARCVARAWDAAKALQRPLAHYALRSESSYAARRKGTGLPPHEITDPGARKLLRSCPPATRLCDPGCGRALILVYFGASVWLLEPVVSGSPGG